MSFLELFCNGDGRKTIDYNLRIIGFTVVVGLLLSIIYARPACAQTIAVSPTTGDFGNVSVGGDSSVQIFTISHDDDDDLDLTDIALSDDTDYSLDLDAGANPCDSTSPTIAVDGNCTVGVTFSPESTGVLNVTLDISSDDADNSPFRVDLTGTGISSKIAVDPAGFEYGDILVGSSSASQNFVITNIGKGDLKVTGITLSDTSNYSLNLNAGGASSCGSTTPKIKEDENCTVGVTFNPTELGVIDGLLTVTSDDKDDNQFDVVLTGRGGTDGDTDGDGMSDGWELRIIEADPTDGINTIEDVLPNEDFDADGVSNLNEFIDGSNPVNARPDAAVLLSPGDGMTEVVLTPQLQTEAMNDPKEGDVHIRTRWQISTDQDFEDDDKLVLDIISDTHLTSIVVPDLVLFLDTVYFWRAAFSDSAGQISAWPDEPFSFTTVDVDESDSNLNGIPDDQEAACSELFGEEEMPANSMCVNSATGGGQIGLEGSTNVTSIVACRTKESF